MPRTSRVAPGGMLFHVLNRGVGRQRLFDKPADDMAFEEVREETLAKQPMRIGSDCLMPNHWHFVLWPEHDGDLAAFMQRLTVTHVTRWQKHRRRVGEGHVYQVIQRFGGIVDSSETDEAVCFHPEGMSAISRGLSVRDTPGTKTSRLAVAS